MEIYVQVVGKDDGSSAWYTDTGSEAYLTPGRDLWCLDSPSGDYMRGSAFRTVKAAKRAGREARDLACWDGTSDAEVRYWRYVRGKLVNTRFTRDGRIKR